MSETVTIVHPGTTTDARGNSVHDWDDATETDVRALAVAPGQNPEDRTASREGAVADLTVYLPAGTTIETVDRVEVRGDTYHVDGHPSDWRTPAGARRGIEVRLRRTTG